MKKNAVTLPRHWRKYIDMVEINLKCIADKSSYLEMIEVWLDRMNAKGFEYSVKQNGETVYLRDYPYLMNE